jgi:hypothetical protein
MDYFAGLDVNRRVTFGRRSHSIMESLFHAGSQRRRRSLISRWLSRVGPPSSNDNDDDPPPAPAGIGVPFGPFVAPMVRVLKERRCWRSPPGE